MNLFTRPENAFVARFFSDSNLFNGTVSEGVLKIGDQQIVVETDLRGPVQVAVRPSKVLLGDTPGFPEGLRFDALVREHVLLGEQEEFEVECSEQTTLTVRRAIGSGPPVSIGEAVSVSISRSDMTLMRN